MISTIALAEDNITSVKTRRTQQAYFAFKHLFDFTLAFLLLPLLVLVAILVKLLYLCTGDYAPVIFRHRRVGKNGREFILYKFRTMVPNSDTALTELLKDPEFKKEWEACHKLENDPRITRIGKILRKTSIDELPQILNIIKGEMSLIGPRPITRPEVESYGKNQTKLLSLRPGLTGWWACNGRSCTSDRQRRELELYYCEHVSFLLDLRCFGRTIVKVIQQEGAK